MPLPNDFVSMIGYTVSTIVILSFVNVLTLSTETRMQTICIAVV
jgi:hypothetical protein